MSTRKRRVLGGTVGAVAIIALVLWYGLSALNRPVTAHVQIGQEKSSLTSYAIDLTPTPVAGHYVAFQYPRGLSLLSRSKVSVVSVEDFNFYVKDISSWTLAIDITETPTGNLSESSSYTLRKNKPEVYHEAQSLIHGRVIHIMSDTSDTNSFSKVAYATHGTLLATISLLGSDAKGAVPLQTTFDMVLNSWQWL